MWCDGRVARERKILTEYGIENPRVDGSIPSQATSLKAPISDGWGFFHAEPESNAENSSVKCDCETRS
jgi:hypothetical protein